MLIERQFITPKQAAVILDCHVHTVLRALKAGALKGQRLKRTWRVSMRSLADFRPQHFAAEDSSPQQSR